MPSDFIPRAITGTFLIASFLSMYFFAPALFTIALVIGLCIILFYEWLPIGSWWLTPLFPILPLLLMIALNQSPDRRLLLFIFGLSILFDCAGYFFGSLWGRHKIAPVLSPKKTWEGFIAGFLVVYLCAPFLMYYLNLKGLNQWWLVPFITLYCILAFSGDLTVSYFKRRSGIKHSSNLLPGHGGLLDRLASVSYTTIFVYALKNSLV